MERGISISIAALFLAIASMFIPLYGAFLTIPAALLALFAIHKGDPYGIIVLLIDIAILYFCILQLTAGTG